MKFVLLLVVSLVILSCATSTKKVGPLAKTADFFFEQGYKQVTFLGENDSPRFSNSGNEIIFVSRQRNSHKGAQVYEIDLQKNRERRITFHDGDASNVSYINDRDILYASTTDEIKESPFLSKSIDKNFPPTELYLSDVYGADIERLTSFPGYDNESIYVSQTSPFIIFTSQRGGLTGIFKYDVKTKQTSFLVVTKDKENRYPALSADKRKLVWVERDLKSNKQVLKLMTLATKKVEILKDSAGLVQDLFWLPNSSKIYYSVTRKDDARSQLEVYDIEKKCTQGLFKGKESLLQPTLSNTAKPKIAFVGLSDGKKQIYMVDLPSDLGPCFEQNTSTKLKK